MSIDQPSRRDLLAAAGVAASCAGLVPSIGRAAVRPVETGDITDMTMNAPSYATPIGYGRPGHEHDAVDPVSLAFGS